MTTAQSPNPADDSQSNAFAEKDEILLERVAEKLVLFGQQVGVTPEEMISLLDSDTSIHDFFVFLASKSSRAASRRAPR